MSHYCFCDAIDKKLTLYVYILHRWRCQRQRRSLKVGMQVLRQTVRVHRQFRTLLQKFKGRRSRRKQGHLLLIWHYIAVESRTRTRTENILASRVRRGFLQRHMARWHSRYISYLARFRQRKESNTRRRCRSKSILNRAIESWAHMVHESNMRAALVASITQWSKNRLQRTTLRWCFVNWCKVCTGMSVCASDWQRICIGLLLRHVGGRGWKEWRMWRLHAVREVNAGSKWKTFLACEGCPTEMKVSSLSRQRRDYLFKQREKLARLAVAICAWRRLCTEGYLVLIGLSKKLSKSAFYQILESPTNI